MAGQLYKVNNGPSATTSATAKVTTGTSAKTLLQLLQGAANMRVVEWGISFDGTTSATPIQCELITTGTVASTVTAFVANDVTYFSDPGATTGSTAAGLTLSTTGSGYTSTSEGSVVAPVRSGDYQLISPTNQYIKQFPLGREFEVPATHCLRIRVTAGTAVNAVCYVIFEI